MEKPRTNLSCIEDELPEESYIGPLCVGVFLSRTPIKVNYAEKESATIETYKLEVVFLFFSVYLDFVMESFFHVKDNELLNVVSDRPLKEQVLCTRYNFHAIAAFFEDFSMEDVDYDLFSSYYGEYGYKNIYKGNFIALTASDILSTLHNIEKEIFPKAMNILNPWYESRV